MPLTRPTPAAADPPPEQKGQQWREHLIPQFLDILNSAKAAPVMPRHKFWGAGEPDCPQDIKAPNGELHTMRCKVCGDGWRNSTDVCFAALSRPASAPMDAMRAALREIDPCAEEAYTDEQIARLVAASPAAAAGVPTEPDSQAFSHLAAPGGDASAILLSQCDSVRRAASRPPDHLDSLRLHANLLRLADRYVVAATGDTATARHKFSAERAELSNAIAAALASPVAPAGAPTEERITEMHRSPAIRDALLAYFDRPCDKEAADVVRAVLGAAPGAAEVPRAAA